MTIRLTTLDNGLRVVTDSVDHVETASVGLWLGAGARQEDAAINGVAHLIEHMLFKGTARRSAQDIAEQIEAVGGALNAYTTRENTAYYAKVLKEDLALAVDIIGDMVMNPALDGAELDRERSVVLQEIGQTQDTPDDIIFDHMQTVAFPDQALGRPVLGTVETVAGLGRDTLFGFIAGQYGAGRAVLSAAGRVDHDALVELAAGTLDAMPAGGPVPAPESGYRGGEARAVQDLEQVHLLFGFQGVSVHDDDLVAQAVYSTILGGGMSSRLFQEVREKRGLVYSIFSTSSSYTDTGLFRIYAGTGAHQVADLVPVICDEVAGLAGDLSDAELDRGKAQLRAQVLMGLESMDGRCEQHALNLLRYGRVIDTDEMTARIAAVDRAAVGRIGARLLAGAPSLAALGPVEGLEPYHRIQSRLAA
jgi:predicted Zn-dependent peptidase